ncbi:GIY-YIG nuclease family protein [Acetobacterium tundrae]|uniref:GIY-YIG nuclease family protein n=1 Tax=Acetobacterium tundrae TaxID=132932 RepID=A0ABR6WPE6_9FIRM|nr:GIY-YIG nuclease family protein [Acetobacterium tundrae]
MDKAYVYIVECKDGTLYTGWTKNIEARVKVHNSGNGAKYTRSRLPVNLVFWEEFETKSEALIREAAIKKMTRKQKLILINGLDKQERGR